jgi:diguanylate cyclase
MGAVAAILLYSAVAVVLVFAGGGGAYWLVVRSKATVAESLQLQAATVLAPLEKLLTRVVFDVDEHSSQVGEINAELASVAQPEPSLIVAAVAKLISVNEEMQKKLASTEGKLHQQAKQIQVYAAEARTDALTLLANRRAFDDELGRRFAEFRRDGRAFSLVLADVDHFKQFNDRYGHQAGDVALQTVGKLLGRKLRDMDLLARYGGEEFAIILPGTGLRDACTVAQRTCQSVAEACVRHAGRELAISASFGVAEACGRQNTAALVGRADEALYAAKAGGRACVHFHDGKQVRRFDPAELPALAAAVERAPHPPLAVETAPAETAGGDGAAESGLPLPTLVDLGIFSDLPSRTAFCQQVRHRMAEWRRGGPPFAVLLVKLHRKGFEEQECGPRATKTVMNAATRFLAASLREMDVAGQYAPGCFGLLLPSATLAGAARTAERLLEHFSAITAQAAQRRLMLSVGVVEILGKDSFVSLLKRAEAAMDLALQQGGNSACCHDGERAAPIATRVRREPSPLAVTRQRGAPGFSSSRIDL